MLYDWGCKYKSYINVQIYYIIYVQKDCKKLQNIIVNNSLFKDANDDIAGALKIGMKGILVKTGKYLNGIEDSIHPLKPTFLLNNFSDAIDVLEKNNFEI